MRILGVNVIRAFCRVGSKCRERSLYELHDQEGTKYERLRILQKVTENEEPDGHSEPGSYRESKR